MARQGGTSTQWRRARGMAFRVHGNACVQCGDKATEIDHIIEVDSGGTDDIENLQPLCSPCHRVKTSKYNSKRMTKKPESSGFFLYSPPPPTLSLSYLSPRLTEEPPIAQKSPKKAK